MTNYTVHEHGICTWSVLVLQQKPGICCVVALWSLLVTSPQLRTEQLEHSGNCPGLSDDEGLAKLAF